MRRLGLWAVVVCLLASVPVLAQDSKDKKDVSLDAADECAELDVEAMGTASVDLTGTWSGTVTYYGVGLNGTTDTLGTDTSNDLSVLTVAGYKQLRACFTTATSGTVVVNMLAVGVGGGSSGSGGGDVTSNGANIATETTLAAVQTALGSLNVTVGTEPGAGTTGNAVPAAAKYLGVNVSGNTTGVTGSTEGSLVGLHTILVDPTTNAAVTYDGCTWISYISAASVNETAVKATAGRVYAISAFSLDATPVYWKFYNDTAANIDETDTPILRMMIPANSTAALGAGFTMTWPGGATFSTAITFRATVGLADNDTATLTANEVLFNVCYI